MPDLRDKDPVEIAHETILKYEQAQDKQYAEYAYYSAVILARELIAFKAKIDELTEQVTNLKELLDTDGQPYD